MRRAPLPVLLSIPHGGDWIPPEVRGMVELGPREIFEDGDAFTREIFNLSPEVAYIADTEVARAVVDLNRAPDALPPKNPDGVIKLVTAMGVPVYKGNVLPPPSVVKTLLEKYYYPYHEKLELLSGSSSVALALDCHSMAAVGPPTARDAGEPRPLICLGNRGDTRGLPKDETTTCPEKLVNLLRDGLRLAFENEDVEVSSEIQLNKPFAGGYIIQRHGCGGVPWIQVEINRALYLDKRWFDDRSLTLDPGRIKYLRNKLLKSLSYVLG